MPEEIYELPIKTQSLSGKKKWFNTEDDIWNDVGKFIEKVRRENKKQGKTRTNGQELYHNILGSQYWFHKYIIEDWMLNMVEEYAYTQAFNIPMSRDLDSADSFRLDCFAIIRQEFQAIEIMKNG